MIQHKMLRRVFTLVGLEKPVPEFRFHPTRRWRFDWAWPDRKLAVEYEGGSHSHHHKFYGYRNDLEKYNEAALLGWAVFRYGPRQSALAKRQLNEFLQRTAHSSSA